jgi:hypothetical protein
MPTDQYLVCSEETLQRKEEAKTREAETRLKIKGEGKFI